MKHFSELITIALAAGASATPAKKDWSKVRGPVDGLLLPLDIPGPQSQYEIGKKSGRFARVDGSGSVNEADIVAFGRVCKGLWSYEPRMYF